MIETTPLILDGKKVAESIHSKIKDKIDRLKENNSRLPGLAVLLVGDNPASHAYVRNKEKACTKVGIKSEVIKMPASSSLEEILESLDTLNNRDDIDGILVQLPLPNGLDSDTVIKSINPKKDVDGLHPINLGLLLSGNKGLIPCTPKGIIEILKYYNISIEGKNAVVLGRSNLVGKPISLLLQKENATVTMVHSRTKGIEGICKNADILIAAIGRPKLVNSKWIKEDSVIIDVGINKITVNEKSKLVGDVDFEEAKNHCTAITPVPGGVGPMTVAMLLENTLEAYKAKG